MIIKKQAAQRGTLRKEGASVLFALRRVVLLCSYIWTCVQVILPFGSLKANKISLKPQGFNITLPIGKITL